MINKEKVDEILADMKEEERKKQEAIEAEVDKFLEGRLEYYVAMVMNRKCMPHSELVSCVASDCPNNHEIVIKKIEEALAEYDYYDCIVSTPISAILGYDGRVSYGFNFRRNYTNIYNADCKADQSEIVENRQIELGLRLDPVKEMEREHQRVRDEIEWNRKYHENYRKLFSREKQKTTSTSPKIILVVIIISLILLFAFLK